MKLADADERFHRERAGEEGVSDCTRQVGTQMLVNGEKRQRIERPLQESGSGLEVVVTTVVSDMEVWFERSVSPQPQQEPHPETATRAAKKQSPPLQKAARLTTSL